MVNQKFIINFSIGLVISFIVWSCIIYLSGNYYIEYCEPLYKLSIKIFSSNIRLVSLNLSSTQTSDLIVVMMKNIYPFTYGGIELPADTLMKATTLQGHALIHPIILFSMALAWPQQRFFQRFLALTISLPFLLIIEMIDIPLVLLGSVEDLVLANLAPHLLDESIMIMLMNFLNGGGRIAITVAAAIMSISLCQVIRIRLFDRG